MVTKEEVEQLMLQYFPSCPLCRANEGYEISGAFKNYVQCRSCGAKWESPDFVKCEELKELQLWEASYDGKGDSLKRKKYSVKFWQDSKAIEKTMKAIEKTKEVKDMESKVELIFRPEMTDRQLQDSIVKSLEEITRWDYGSTLYGKLGSLLSGTSFSEAATIRLLRAIFEQNKILIMQNELIYRGLTQRQKINAKVQ